MPQISRVQVSRVLRALLPQRVCTADDLLAWLRDTQARNARAKDSHRTRRLRRQREHPLLSCAA